jgi:ribose-phosphate pyrophosphokinase
VEQVINILSNPSSEDLAARVMKSLAELQTNDRSDIQYEHVPVTTLTLADGELWTKISENVRGHRVFLIDNPRFGDDTNPGAVYQGMFRVAFMNQAARLAQAAFVTDVIPYMPFMRQDSKDKPRVAINAREVADMIFRYPTAMALTTIDLHAKQLEGIFSCPVDNIMGRYLFIHELMRDIQEYGPDNVVLVAADQGQSKNVYELAAQLGVQAKAFMKYRAGKQNEIDRIEFNGPEGAVSAKHVRLIDDMFDSGGTHTKEAALLRSMGTQSINLFVTHWLASSKDGVSAEQKLYDSAIDHVFATEANYKPPEYWHKHQAKLTRIPIDKILAQNIHNTSTGKSFSRVYKTYLPPAS